jgi:hypothetical protein
VFEFSEPGWTFTAFIGGSDRTADRLPVEEVGDGRFQITPPPAAGTYDVWLTGKTSDGHGADYLFRWEVP